MVGEEPARPGAPGKRRLSDDQNTGRDISRGGADVMVAPIHGAEVICEFGSTGSSWQPEFHTGRDYRAEVGSPVRSTMAGTVVKVARDDGYGLFVVVQTSGVQHLYGHLSAVSVAVGADVEAGEQLGLSGDSGAAGEPHLHYEERVSPYGDGDHRWPMFDTVGRGGPAHLRRV